jgi:ribonuclease P/MRP protein subunit RPP40
MESIVRDSLMVHFDRNNLLNPDQHGFLTKHSTGSQLLECLNDWSEALELGNCVDVCYIDFSRAFDSVSLPKLLQKLAAYGISGDCINWLRSFLLDRTMCVRINNVCSNTISQLSGVPQGSVLGPICFVMYINDLSKCVKYSKLKLYADDVKLYFCFHCDNWSDLLQKDLDAIAEWAKTWQLNISISKTYILHIGVRNPHNLYNINGVNITAMNTVKDLGVHVTSDLSWSVHVNEVAKKANKVANVILHAFKCHNVDLYMSAFVTYIKPILDYCCYVWNPVLCRDIDGVENVLRAYTRRVFYKCGLPRVSYAERLKTLGLLSIERSRFVSCLTMFYNIYNKFVCCNILNNFTSSEYMLSLRGHNKRLMIPFCRSSIRKNYFTYRFLRVWNELPVSVVSTNISKAFANNVNNLDLNTLISFRY